MHKAKILRSYDTRHSYFQRKEKKPEKVRKHVDAFDVCGSPVQQS